MVISGIGDFRMFRPEYYQGMKQRAAKINIPGAG